MEFIIVGLGNPGDEYEKSRHNTGFLVLDELAGRDADWDESKNGKCLYTHMLDVSGKNKIEFIKPLTYMNNSGASVAYAKKKHPKAHVIVVQDEMDLPLGRFKISYGRGSGGHNGIESITKSLKTREFARIRVGVSPTTPTGKMRKPKGEQKVLNLLMKDFKKDELLKLKRIAKKIGEAIDVITESRKLTRTSSPKDKERVPAGLVKAMNIFN